MALQESGEMYLESILLLSKKNGAVRSVDISEHMGYSKPSVSRAVGLLRSGGYIEVEDDGHITLTPAGLKMAEKILERHQLLTQLLEHLGVDPETASADACKMEHVISDTTFAAIREFVSRNQEQTEL
jgi:Mn-dependent DtxR family transcriptional regulator